MIAIYSDRNICHTHGMVTVSKEWLREQLEQRRGLKADLARNTTLTPVKISRILSGERNITAKEAEEIKAFLGFHEEVLSRHEQAVIKRLREWPTSRLQLFENLLQAAEAVEDPSQPQIDQ